MLNTKLLEKLQKVNFPVEVQNIKGIPSDMARAVVRTDQASNDGHTVLGVVGSRYKPIEHMKAFGGALEQIQSAYTTILADADIKVDTYENGAMAVMECVFPSVKYRVKDHDLNLKFVARNSYNARWKYQSFFGFLNQVCFNTLVSGQKIAYTANRHTNLFDIETSNLKIKKAIEAVSLETNTFEKWWDTKVEDEQVISMFKNTIAKSQATEAQLLAGADQSNQKQLGNLIALYQDEVRHLHGDGDYGRKGAKGSLWCAYQASTAWSTHLTDVKNDNNKKLHIIKEKRQSMVSKMLQSNHWKKLEVA